MIENQQTSEMSEENPDLDIIAETESKNEESEVIVLGEGSDNLHQVEHVHDLALVLFDGMLPLHALDETSREILETASRMLAIPIRISKKKKPHQAAIEAVRGLSGIELPEDKQKVLAAILVFFQGKIKKKELERFDLSPIQIRQVLTICALLRLASGLDHSGSGRTNILKVEPSVEGVYIVIEGPSSASDAVAAQHNSRLWEKIGYPPVEVLEEAEASIRLMPLPEPMEHIGISPDDPISEAGRKVMLYHFAQMLRFEDGTRSGKDIEDLHRMRVATRRLRAAFEVFSAAFEPRTLKIHLKGLRAAGRTLGSVRDMDVFIEKAHHYLETLPKGQRTIMDPLLETWDGQREQARSSMHLFLDSPEYALFKRNFNIFLHTPGAGSRQVPRDQPAPQRAVELVPVLVYTRLASVRSYQSYLPDAPIEQLHALRIEIKKLRYTVEYFQEILGKRSVEVVDSLKKMQDHLGDLNDAEVATQMLRKFIDDWEQSQIYKPIHERRSIEGVMNYMAARQVERHQLMESFIKTWEAEFMRYTFRRNLAQSIAIL